MSQGSYIRAFSSLAFEIENTLSPEDIERARQGLAASGELAWQRWMLEHETDILDFLAATPGKRSKKKAWSDDSVRILLSLGAMVYAQRAFRLAEAADIFLRCVGMSYRDALAETAEAYSTLLFETGSNWPFRGKDPWGGSHPLDPEEE